MGVYDVDAMLAGMSSRLLTEWMAYYSLEPFGAEIVDVHLAKFQAMMASTEKNKQDPQKFRLWKKIGANTGNFDPQEWFNSFKQTVQKLTKKD